MTLVLENATRTMTYVDDGDDILDFRYRVTAGDRAARFSLQLDGTERLVDRNGNEGLATGENVNARFLIGSKRRVDTQGPRITGIRIDSSPGVELMLRIPALTTQLPTSGSSSSSTRPCSPGTPSALRYWLARDRNRQPVPA